MKKWIYLLTAVFLLAMLTACSSGSNNEEQTQGRAEPGSQAHVLDGKKIIFVGCSFTYYGGTIRKTDYLVTSQEERADDRGYFYRLCRENGADVSVMDWCYGGHSLSDLFGGNCNATNSDKGHDHLER